MKKSTKLRLFGGVALLFKFGSSAAIAWRACLYCFSRLASPSVVNFWPFTQSRCRRSARNGGTAITAERGANCRASHRDLTSALTPGSTSMATSLRALSPVTIALAQAAVAQSVESDTPSQIYLKCSIKNDPEGINDVHIDIAKKQFADYFGTVRAFREEGPFLISETFTEVDGARTAVTTVRINRFTLSYQYMWPAQQILKNGQCSLIDKKL